MSDDINKKILIDIEISDDGQKQLDQYKTSINNLRSSVNNLSSPLLLLNKNLSNTSSALNNLNKQNQTTASSGNKLKTTVSDVSDSFKLWYEVIENVKKGFTAWQAALSGGLALLINYGPEILNWISSLTKGKDAIQEATLKLGALNEALQSSDYSNAIEQVSQLKINVDLARKGFLDKKTVLEQYNNTLGQTMGTTNDLNKAEKILLEKGDAYIRMTLLKAEAQLALHEAAQKALEAEQEKHKSDDDELSWWDEVTTSFETSVLLHGNAAKDKAKQNRQEAINDLNKQKDSYTKIASDLEIQASKINKAFNLTSPDDNTPRGSSSGSQEKIQKQQKALQDAETMYKDSLKRRLQATYEAYGSETAAENDHYQDQLTRLKKSLDDKLITKKEYTKVSQQLETEHNASVAAIIDKYNQQDAERVLQAQNELADLQIKGMKDGFAKQIAELTQQQKEREEQYDKADNESAARIEKLGNEMAAAKKANPNANVSQLQKMIDAEWTVINTNNQKRIEDEKQTDEKIVRLKKQAYLQPDEDAVNKAAELNNTSIPKAA